MRFRTLIAIAVTMCALPALAAELPSAPMPRVVPRTITDVLVEIADVKLGAALDEKAPAAARAQLLDDARRGYQRALLKRPEHKDALLGLARFYARVGEREKALEVYKKCLALHPEYAPAQKLLGELKPVEVAPMPREAKQSGVVKLKYAAAADTAHVINTFLAVQKLDAVLVAEPVSNTVLLSAEPTLYRQIHAIVAALDAERPRVTMTVTVMKVPDGFVEACGLNVGAAPGATSWVLSPRELHMLTGLVRAAKERGECEILTRPQLCVCDGQTGTISGGWTAGEVDVWFTFRATPRVLPGGGLLLGTEIQFAEKRWLVVGTKTKPGKPLPVPERVRAVDGKAHQETVELKAGEALVARVGSKLVIVTPTTITK